jgi:hypothetical protein
MTKETEVRQSNNKSKLPYSDLVNRRLSFLEAKTGYSSDLGKDKNRGENRQPKEVKNIPVVDFSKRIRVE